jgi:hypothetical protein
MKPKFWQSTLAVSQSRLNWLIASYALSLSSMGVALDFPLIGNWIKGDTTQDLIGNVGDRLKVDVVLSPSSNLPAWGSTMTYADMNAGTGGIARGASVAQSATWTTIYTYTGSGYVAGMLINVEIFTAWEFRLLVDAVEIFSLLSNDLTSDTIYDVDDVTDVNTAFLGISKGSHDKFTWHTPLETPLRYNTSVTVQVRRQTGGSKKFQAGLIILSK